MGKKIVPDDELEHELRRALTELIGRTHETACVLLEDRATECFVQFGRGPVLLLDLPLVGLSDEEARRAREAFSDLGTDASRSLEAPDLHGEDLSRGFEVLQRSFGDDVDAALAAAREVFERTYRLPEVTWVLHEA